MSLTSTLRSAAMERFGWLYFSRLARRADSSHRRLATTQLRDPEAPDHVLVLVIDACRPDVALDLPLPFTTAVAPAPWTFPSVTSLHTGLYPHQHGATLDHTQDRSGPRPLPAQYPDVPILPATMEGAGYETYGGFGFLVPFQAAKGWYQTHDLGRETPAADLVSAYRSWRRGRDRTFAYLHFQDLHAPLEPPAEYATRHDVANADRSVRHLETDRADFADEAAFRAHREERTRLYRATVEYLSDVLRPLLDAVSEDTLVVLTADHGEAHWEHVDLDAQFDHGEHSNVGYSHSGTPLDTVARVPLAVHSPDGRVATPTDGGWPSLCDVPATVLDAVTTVSFPEGHSWRTEIPSSRTVFCEGGRFSEERKAAYRGRYKVIRGERSGVTVSAEVDRNEGGETFLDIPSSVREDLVAALPEDLETGGREPPESSQFVKEQLQHLGYR